MDLEVLSNSHAIYSRIANPLVESDKLCMVQVIKLCVIIVVLFAILTCECHFFCHLVIKKMNAISFPTLVILYEKIQYLLG